MQRNIVFVAGNLFRFVGPPAPEFDVQLSVRQREFLEALSQTETLPPDKLQFYQRSLLEPLLKHAVENVPFYRNRLDAVLARDGAVDWSRWQDIPTFGIAEAEAAGGDLQTQTR